MAIVDIVLKESWRYIMLTPMEIKDKRFQTAGRNSYKSEDVDLFFDSVVESYEQMFRENAELIKRVSLLAERLEQYKKDEDSIKSAVITAQRAADKIEEEASERSQLLMSESEDILAAAKAEVEIIKKDTIESVHTEMKELIESSKAEAQLILTNAKKDAEDIIREAENEAKSLQGAATRTLTSESILYDMLKKEVSEFKNELMSRYKAHIELITQLPELALQKAQEGIQDEIEEMPKETELFIEETAREDGEEADDKSGDNGEAPVFDESDPDIEFVTGDETNIEGVLSIDDFVNQNEPEKQDENASSPKIQIQDEYVESANIPFDETADSIELVAEAEVDAEDEKELDVNDFISSFEEPLHREDEELQKKKGFSINFSKLSSAKKDEKETAEDEKPAADLIFDSRAKTGFKLKRPAINMDENPESSNEDDHNRNEAKEDDDIKSLFSGDKKKNGSGELKKRFPVIKMNDSENNDIDSTSAKTEDTSEDDDSPSIRNIFKKKK